MRTFFAGTLMLLLTIAGWGCVQDNADSPIAILYNQQPGVGCSISGTETGAGISRGIIDAYSSVGYVFTPLIKNYAQTTPYIDAVQRIAHLDGAIITVAVDGQLVDEFSTYFGAVVAPDGGTAGLKFELLPLALVAQLASGLGGPEDVRTVQTTTRLFGRMAGGSIETQEFAYTIDVCNGCLINDLGTCSLLNGDATNLGGRCNPLQDAAAVDCCTENDLLVCPAISAINP